MNNTNFERIISLAAKDTKKGSRVVAKVFYRILRKKGFSENQIIDIATNIINCLTESLKGYEKKIENAKEHEENTIKENTPKKDDAARTFTKFRSRYGYYDDMHYSDYI
jgi:hypothetical protein